MSAMNDLVRDALKIFRPPPDLKISEWADAERYLSSESSAEPGKYNSARAPYQREMMDAVLEPEIEDVVIMTSAQVGKTEIIQNITGYFCENDPSPLLNVQPTLEMARTYSEDRLAPMVRDTPALTRVFAMPGSRQSGNTILKKKFRGAQITMAGANSPASLASRPVRGTIMDEIDRFGASAGDEGDPVSLAKKRTTTFSNRFAVMVSTPTRRGNSRIEAAWKESDQRRFMLPCLGCDFKFVPRFTIEAAPNEDFWNGVPALTLQFNDNDPASAHFACTSCGMVIDHDQKRRMLAAGKWVKFRPEVKKIAGFHLNEFYSPWKSWAEIVEDYLTAKQSAQRLQTFVNTSLGETYEIAGDAPEWKRLYDRREEYRTNTIPAGVKFITCAVDVQKNRFEVEVKGWGARLENWSIDYRKFYGDTSNIDAYSPLDDLLNEKWIDSEGQPLTILRLAIDSGYNSQEVYKWAKKYPRSRVMVVKGSATIDHTFQVPKENADWTAVPIWRIGVSVVKREIYGWLKQEIPSDEVREVKGFPRGWCHFPSNYPEEYFKMLTAEAEEMKILRGYPQYVWVKKYDRNEALDLAVYNRAVAAALGLDKSGKKDESLALKARVAGSVDPSKPRKPKIIRKKSSFLD